MAGTKIIACIAALLALCGCSTSGTNPRIRVGSKNFTEQVVLGEIIAQHLEHRLHRKVERSLNLGGTLLAHQALLSHANRSLSGVHRDGPGRDSQGSDRHRSRASPSARAIGILQRFHVEWLDPLGIDDSFAMVVSGPEARARSIGDSDGRIEGARAAGRSAWATSSSSGRTDWRRWRRPTTCVGQGKPKTMDLGLLYKAMEQGQVTMIAANATDGLLSKMDLQGSARRPACISALSGVHRGPAGRIARNARHARGAA